MFPIEQCSGVYLLICKQTGKKYVGASFNVKKRTAVHMRKNSFDAFLLERVPRNELPAAERKWIIKLQPELNIRPFQNGGSGQKRSAKAIIKMSAWQKGIKRPHNNGSKISVALKGVKKSEAHRKKAAAARKAVGNKPWNERQRNAQMKAWTKKRKAQISKRFKGKPWSIARRLAQEARFG
jgi:hypothetical protein